MNRKQLVVNGLVTTYYQEGQGPPLLLIHGWADQAKTFSVLAGKLSSHYQIIAPDMPGFGETALPAKAWGLEDYGQFLKGFLEKLEVEKPHAIIAHSNGGSVAIRALANSRIIADKLVLLASAGIRDRQKARRLGFKIIAKTGKAATLILPAEAKQRLRKKLYGAAGSDMLVAPHIEETFKKTVRQDVQNDARALHLPTLLIYGGKDQATPPAYGEVYKKLIENSRLEVIEGSDHFVHHKYAEKVAGLISEFLK